MNAQTVGWLVFLALIQNISCDRTIPVELKDRQLTTKEGSCIEIKCRVKDRVDDNGAYWFWMKDAKWNGNDFDATIIYSTNNSTRPVSPDFAGRVKYTGSLSSSWKYASASSPQPMCSILICNLKKTDSGEYSFRFVGPSTTKFVTKSNVTLTVTENPCLITFEKPPIIKESDMITLTCSTSSSCSSDPQIEDLSQLHSTQLSKSQQNTETHKSTTVSFQASWQDDGRVFSCQTPDNTDQYLIQNISITVEYAPKDIVANKSSENIKEGDSVTLTCFAKGVPNPTFTWFKKDVNKKVSSEPEWKITSINDSKNGEYHCEARNKYKTIQSKPVTINVTYAPYVEIKMTPPVVTQGDKMTLTCNVKRSNPQPQTYAWFKNGTYKRPGQTYDIYQVKPEDSGSYTCTATNTVGPGTSEPFDIRVQHIPRKSNISISESNHQVKVGKPLKFTCDSVAYPPPSRYSWYRYNPNKKIDSSQWTSRTTNEKILHLSSVQRADEAFYMCNATNSIGTGDDSVLMYIKVLYPPTEPMLSVPGEVTEGQTITISCTVESSPESDLTLTRTSASNLWSSEWHLTQHGNYWQYTFNVTSDDAGFYTCDAKNSEGSYRSIERKLVVKYAPKNVIVRAEPDLVVNENNSLTLQCSAQSYPQANSFTWMKMTNGKDIIIKMNQTFNITFVSPSDRGLYRCEARNEIGTGKSQHAEVKVKYAPKHTNIMRAAEMQEPDGKSSMALSCNSDSYPPVTQYLWYKKEEDKEGDIEVSKKQNYTVYSDKPGVYYCIAKNEINQKSSEPVHLFDRSFMKFLKLSLCLVLILLIILIIIIVVYRHRKNSSIQQGTAQPCFGFPGWSNGARRRNLIHETVLTEPFRSRDDLLPDQPYRPQAQQCQPRPDSTPASNISTVYSTVNAPPKKQAPTAQKPTRPQVGHTVDDSLNYASLHFGDKQKNIQAKPTEDIVYAKVSKPKPFKKNEWLEDYENIRTSCAAKSPHALNDDTDSSSSDDDYDVQLNYTQVTFTATPGHQRASRDSTSSDEDEIQYSDVKI